jgi:hypothetical protein
MSNRVSILPHGAVSVSGIEANKVREALRKVIENQVAIAKEIEQLKRGGSK